MRGDRKRLRLQTLLKHPASTRLRQFTVRQLSKTRGSSAHRRFLRSSTARCPWLEKGLFFEAADGSDDPVRVPFVGPYGADIFLGRSFQDGASKRADIFQSGRGLASAELEALGSEGCSLEHEGCLIAFGVADRCGNGSDVRCFGERMKRRPSSSPRTKSSSVMMCSPTIAQVNASRTGGLPGLPGLRRRLHRFFLRCRPRAHGSALSMASRNTSTLP